MANVVDNKIMLVVRPTRLDDLVARFNSVPQAQFYVEHLGADFSDYLAEDDRYRHAVAQATETLEAFARVQRLDRRYLANFVFGPADRVVVLGQDGLVANTLKYLDGQRVIGVNPEPKRWDGVLLPFVVEELSKIMKEELARKRPVRRVTMAKAPLNTGTTLYAVNDLFIGPRSHISARYSISVGGREETQSSSGIIVSTGLGSTGWLKSIYAGWAATTYALGNERIDRPIDSAFPWDADYLHYFVREPFPSRTTGCDIVIGRISHTEELHLTSQMPEHGVIFSDGLESDFLEFNSGTKAVIRTADREGVLVV